MKTITRRMLFAGALLGLLTAAAPLAAAPETAKAPQRFLTPARRDGINDAAVFGPAAREVTVFDLRGRVVFHQSSPSGAPIVWDGRDRSGAIPPSGIYIAKIRTAASETVYQSFALAK
jgi:hypothetical protein